MIILSRHLAENREKKFPWCSAGPPPVGHPVLKSLTLGSPPLVIEGVQIRGRKNLANMVDATDPPRSPPHRQAFVDVASRTEQKLRTVRLIYQKSADPPRSPPLPAY